MVHVNSAHCFTNSDIFSEIDRNDFINKKMHIKKYKLIESNESKCYITCFASRKPGYYLINYYSFNFLITLLGLSLFVLDVNSADKRLIATFTLILTLFNFKIVTTNSLPIISYLTSLDKYQFLNLLYLVICCAWNSICIWLNQSIETSQKIQIDRIGLGILVLLFIGIQIKLVIDIYRSYLKIKKIETINDRYIEMIQNDKLTIKSK